ATAAGTASAGKPEPADAPKAAAKEQEDEEPSAEPDAEPDTEPSEADAPKSWAKRSASFSVGRPRGSAAHIAAAAAAAATAAASMDGRPWWERLHDKNTLRTARKCGFSSQTMPEPFKAASEKYDSEKCDSEKCNSDSDEKGDKSHPAPASTVSGSSVRRPTVASARRTRSRTPSQPRTEGYPSARRPDPPPAPSAPETEAPVRTPRVAWNSPEELRT
ncbi:unnamed protein product, partial [Effrenium voratum]